MKLSEQQVKIFQDIYQKKYGESLEFEDAQERAVRLLKLIEIVERNAVKLAK